MRRGTRIAQAYISASVDGSGINDEIVDSVHEAGPGVDREGEEAGDRYGDRFSGRFRRKMDGIRSQVGDRLSHRLGDAGGDAGDAAGRNFVDRVSTRVRTYGDRIGSELSDRMASNPEQVRRGINRAFDDDFADRLGARLGDRMADAVGRRMEDALADSAARMERLLNDDRVSGNGRRRRVGRDDNDISSRVARMLGAGSRNNFINIIGRSAGGLVKSMTSLFGMVGKVQTGASALFTTFRTGFINANGAADALTGIMGGMGAVGSKALAGLAESGPAALAVMAAVGVALTLLVSIASALLAIVVALAATIASALVGALAVAAGAFAAVAGAAGLATLAFMSMTNKQKEALSSAFRPLHQEAIGLGQVMLTQMVPAFAQWSGHLQHALALAEPLARVMGGAFAQAGNILTSSLSGPGVQLFLSTLSVTLPGIVTHLSSALGGFINGLSGMFAALMPFVLQFSIYLENVATTFANWASSAKGQNAISDFVGRALVSLKSLWNFLGALGGLISALFFSPEAQGAGNNIFDSMSNALRRFTDYIQQDNRMQRWFAEGVVFAQALGDAIVTISRVLQSLNNSGVIDGLARIADIGASAYSWFSQLPRVMQDILVPMQAVADIAGYIGSIVGTPGSTRSDGAMQSDLGGLLGEPMGMTAGQVTSGTQTGGGAMSASQIQAQIDAMMASANASTTALQNSGATALANTYQNAGGYMANPKKTKPKYKNPYKDFAESLIKQGPSIAAQIRNALLSVNRQVAGAIRDATRATSGDAVAQALNSSISSMTTSAKQTVNTAQSALNSAAQTLANANSPKAAAKALKAVKRAQKNLRAATRDQRRVNRAARMVAAQEVVHASKISRIDSLLDGNHTGMVMAVLRQSNTTLADYAEARAVVAQHLNEANQKLAEATSLRDNYLAQVSDSIKTYGALTTAQAKVIDGVEQALTAQDITSNLQDRLTAIQHFQTTLNRLLSMGLSNDAYKQIVDMGVEQGTAYADALDAGGLGSIQQTNGLVSNINSAADALGVQASNRLYQAGVDAAQGLVDGLTSLSAQLDSAATQLGNSIAAAVKKALGIKSPSRVLRGMMGYVGDGIELGLDDQHPKVGAAASRLAGQVAVSPEVAAYASLQGTSPTVSGNDGKKFRDLIVQTPTEDPAAVAHEVMNEIVGRL